MSNIVKLKRSAVFNKTPLPSQLDYGELCLNFNSSNPFLSFKDSENEIQKFLSENKVRNLIADVKNDVDASFYTKIESDAKYQTLSGMSSYLTVASAEGLYQPKGDYALVSQLPDLTDYALKSELPDLTDYALKSEIPDTSNFAEKSEIPSIEGLASLSDLANYQPISGMSSYLTVASAEGLYQPKGDYALVSQIPSVEGFVTLAYTEATYMKIGDVPTDVYTKSETDTLLAGKASSSHTHTASEIVDLDVPKIWKGTLSEYTNLTEIDNDTLYVITDESEQFTTSGDVASMISGFTTLSEVQVELEGYSQTGHTHSQYLTQASADSRYARVVSCTQAEYDALVQNDQVEQGVLYCITESNSQSSSDSGNSGSGNSGDPGGYNPGGYNPVTPDPIIPDPDPDPTDF